MIYQSNRAHHYRDAQLARMPVVADERWSDRHPLADLTLRVVVAGFIIAAVIMAGLIQIGSVS